MLAIAVPPIATSRGVAALAMAQVSRPCEAADIRPPPTSLGLKLSSSVPVVFA